MYTGIQLTLKVNTRAVPSCISQIGGIVRVQLSLGAGPVGMVYPVCALVSNIHTMFYGNTVSASVPGAQNILATLSLETYLDV